MHRILASISVNNQVMVSKQPHIILGSLLLRIYKVHSPGTASLFSSFSTSRVFKYQIDDFEEVKFIEFHMLYKTPPYKQMTSYFCSIGDAKPVLKTWLQNYIKKIFNFETGQYFPKLVHVRQGIYALVSTYSNVCVDAIFNKKWNEIFQNLLFLHEKGSTWILNKPK